MTIFIHYSAKLNMRKYEIAQAKTYFFTDYKYECWVLWHSV